MSKHFMSNEDALQVLGAYAEEINRTKPIEITYENYLALSETDKNTHRYIITDYPSRNVDGDLAFGELADTQFSNLSNNDIPLYDSTTQKWKNSPVPDPTNKQNKVLTNPITVGTTSCTTVEQALTELASAVNDIYSALTGQY